MAQRRLYSYLGDAMSMIASPKRLLQTLRPSSGVSRAALAYVGAASAVTGVIQFVLPDVTIHPLAATVALISIGLLLHVVNRSSAGLRATAGVYDWSIEIRSGNLLDWPRLAVTTDRYFRSSLTEVGDASLVGQLVNRFGPDEVEQAFVPVRTGRSLPANPGEVATVCLDGVEVLLVPLASDDTEGGSITTWRDLATGFDGLWAALRRSNSTNLAVPILGSGFAGAVLDRRVVLSALIVSFHAACLERPVCKTLTVVLAGDVHHSDFDVRELLRSLGYSVGRL